MWREEWNKIVKIEGKGAETTMKKMKKKIFKIFFFKNWNYFFFGSRTVVNWASKSLISTASIALSSKSTHSFSLKSISRNGFPVSMLFAIQSPWNPEIQFWWPRKCENSAMAAFSRPLTFGLKSNGSIPRQSKTAICCHCSFLSTL